MNSIASFITIAACPALQKKKNVETNGKANQLHQKESCHLSNINSLPCHSAFFLFFPPPPSGSHFQDWILKTLYIINRLHASSVRPALSSCSSVLAETKSNKSAVCAHTPCFLFFLIQPIISWCHVCNSTGSPFRLYKCAEEGGVKTNPKEHQAWATLISVKHKRTAWCGLKRLDKNCVQLGKMHRKSFHIRLD